MKFLKRRKLNGLLNGVYSQYKKVNVNDKIDNISFQKAVENCYNGIKSKTEIHEYNSYLMYRYTYLRNDFSNTLSLIFLLATTFIPAIVLNIFNPNLFKGVDSSHLILAILFAFIVISIVVFGCSLIAGAIIAPWVYFIFPLKITNFQNIEISVIYKNLPKRLFVKKIDRKKLVKKAFRDGVITLLASIVVWIFICLKF